MRRKVIRTWMILTAILALPLLVLMAQQATSLTVDGQQGQARVIQVQGKNFVDVDGLAKITGASLRFAGNQVVLTLPASNSGAPTQTAQQAAPQGYSKQFLGAGIEAMTQVREWHAALKNAVERGYPLSDEWLGAFKRQAQTSLQQAQVAASTDMDHQIFPLMSSELSRMSALSDQYLKMTANRDYIAPNSLASDPIEQKLLTCGKSLALMVSSNAFIDDGSCQ